METRRTFLRTMAGVTAGMMLPVGWGCKNAGPVSDRLGELLPLRKLGTTGEKVTMLGVGGYHIGWTTEKDAVEVIEAAIEGGIRFFDTAHNYGKGLSEERYGKFLIPKYRDEIFLMTKSSAKDGESLLKEFDLSLSRMNTGHVDLLQLHSLDQPGDVDNRVANGVMEAILSIKESGKARYIGFTGHRNPYSHLRMMEHMPDYPGFSTLQMPINVLDAVSEHSFINAALPVAIENNLGILAMKTLADGRFFSSKTTGERLIWETETPVVPGHVSIRESLFFSWTMPISTLITGAENSEMLNEKIGLAREFVNLTDEEKDFILDKAVEALDRDKVEYYKRIEA